MAGPRALASDAFILSDFLSVRQVSFHLSAAHDSDIANKIALVQAPKRRLLSAKAAAHYLGIDQRTLKRITEGGTLVSRALGPRRVYLLEELKLTSIRCPRSI